MSKTSVLTAYLLLASLNGFAQESPTSAADSAKATAANSGATTIDAALTSHPLKTANQVLPRWAIDLNYRIGSMTQNMTLINLNKAYDNPQGTSSYADPDDANFQSMGGDVTLSYFFNKSRQFGVGLGIMYTQYTGDISLKNFYQDFREKDMTGNVYRQIIRMNAPLQEALKITNVNIPLLFRFKHQFGRLDIPGRASKFGVTADIGPVFGIYNQTETNASGNFSYEAVYKSNPANGPVTDFPTKIDDASNSFILTEDYYNKTHADGNAQAYFDNLRNSQGFNVGLNKAIDPAQNGQKNNYNALGLGGIFQAAVTYSLTYRVAFQLGGYLMYQSWQNTGNENYKITEARIPGNTVKSAPPKYAPVTGAVDKANYLSYGASIGFRIFLGGKQDIDGDGYEDSKDRCPLAYGTQFGGCPDNDNDGIPDINDDCPSDYGTSQGAYTGCPDDDGDGVPNKIDECPYEAGELRNGCPISSLKEYVRVDSLRDENNKVLAPHDLLETDVLHFGYNRSDIQDSVAAILDYAANLLKKDTGVVIYISGYTDDIGSARSNLFLSYERAKSAKAYLISKGVEPNRVIIGSYGKENPAVPNDSPQNQAKNRRIEMKLLLPVREKVD